MIHDTQSAQISQEQDERNIYEIMKTMCPPGYHHNGFVATHAHGHVMYKFQKKVNFYSKNHSEFISLLQIHFDHDCNELSKEKIDELLNKADRLLKAIEELSEEDNEEIDRLLEGKDI